MQVDEIWTYVHCKKERLAPESRNGEWDDQLVLLLFDFPFQLIQPFHDSWRVGTVWR